MSKAIAKMFSQQFGTKITLKSQQTGKMYGKKKSKEFTPHERIPKKTSIGKRPKMSSMNKHKKRSYKPKNRGGS